MTGCGRCSRGWVTFTHTDGTEYARRCECWHERQRQQASKAEDTPTKQRKAARVRRSR